ncbi:MAG: hypothetical protein A2Y80_07350 [Deltaproteobacteria bacterium RBG_13_58_19]|nr:MAG: hypothetical protein A2Y80_07350 [Deltaproteobacteria bacterium RBG_13_58_19]
MIDRAQFELIKMKYGHYASWAIWADEGEKPKDNVGNLSVFDIESNVGLLHQLNPGIILVGLNISRRIEVPLANFHDARPQAMDYKIRYALKESPFWGAYMTDIIKDFEQKVSGKMMSYLRTDKPFEDKNVEIFREEMKDLRIDNPTIVAFGRDAYTILNRNFKNKFKIFKIPHYSNYTGKEKYREEVKSILGFK